MLYEVITSIRLIPVGEIGFQQLMFQLALDKIDKGIRAHEYSEALGDIVLYVDRIDADNGWHGVYVSDMRNRSQPLITLAKRGHMQADMEHLRVTVILEDGSLHNQQGQDNQVVRFGRYVITSYSIHYTKLYDFGLRWVRLSRARLSVNSPVPMRKKRAGSASRARSSSAKRSSTLTKKLRQGLLR